MADRIEDNAAFLGDIVDRELHRRRKAADHKFTFSFSTSSSVRVAASPGLSLSSRTTSSALRPLRPPASLN